MRSFLSDLLQYCTAHSAPPSGNPQYKADLAQVCALEEQIQEALGEDFLTQYGLALYRFSSWELLDVFQQGLRFGAQFSMEIMAQSSTSMP